MLMRKNIPARGAVVPTCRASEASMRGIDAVARTEYDAVLEVFFVTENDVGLAKEVFVPSV
jgi:hypothetical protein